VPQIHSFPADFQLSTEAGPRYRRRSWPTPVRNFASTTWTSPAINWKAGWLDFGLCAGRSD